MSRLLFNIENYMNSKTVVFSTVFQTISSFCKTFTAAIVLFTCVWSVHINSYIMPELAETTTTFCTALDSLQLGFWNRAMLLQDCSHHHRSFMVVIMNSWIGTVYPSAPWKLYDFSYFMLFVVHVCFPCLVFVHYNGLHSFDWLPLKPWFSWLLFQ